MQRNLNYQNDRPTLYLIPTPIGNLEDITLRSLKILETVDVLYAEDTRVTRKLLSHYNISKTTFSLHEHNETVRYKEVIEKLDKGLNVGLVSDAGMPLLSDPGLILAKEVMAAGYNVTSLPGANALLPALAMSGLNTHPFAFFGFLDSKKNKRIKELERIKYYPETLIFYEAIHRINDTLEDMYEILGNRKFTIAREISKTYEEIISGELSEFAELGELKGELVIVIEGYQNEKKVDISLVEQVDFFVASGMKKTEAMKRVSEMTGIPKNKIYEEYLNSHIKPTIKEKSR